MKRILLSFLLVLLSATFAIADVDTLEGQASTDTCEGQSSVDTREGQTVASGGTCADENIYPDGDNYAGWRDGTGSDQYGQVNTSTVNDATYIAENGDYRIDWLTMEDLECSSGTITSVVVTVRCQGNLGSGASIRFGVRVDATDYTQASDVSLTDSWAEYTNTFTENPSTSSAWTISEVNAAIVALNSRAGYVDEPACSQVYFEVTYE